MTFGFICLSVRMSGVALSQLVWMRGALFIAHVAPRPSGYHGRSFQRCVTLVQATDSKRRCTAYLAEPRCVVPIDRSKLTIRYATTIAVV